MNNTVVEPSAQKRQVSQAFHQQAQAWLSSAPALAHWWSEDAELLDEAACHLQALAQGCQSARVCCVFRQGDFLALLQRLNALLAAAQSAVPQAQAHAGEVWVLEQAQSMSAEHVDILRRICLHYPELQMHLALLSQVTQAPAQGPGLQVHALSPLVAARAADAASTVAGKRRWMLAGLLATGLLLSLSLWWPGEPGVSITSGEPSAAAPSAAMAPASPSASPLAPSPVSDAVAAKPVVQPPQFSSQTTSEGPVSASRRWLLGLPADSLVVVHAELATLREAEVFRAGKSVLANARILLTSGEGVHPRYLVVTGPFRSPERAQNYTQRLEWKASARSHRRQDLLEQVRH